jgi:hypothetical protein
MSQNEGKYKGLLNFGRKTYRNAVTEENKEKNFERTKYTREEGRQSKVT